MRLSGPISLTALESHRAGLPEKTYLSQYDSAVQEDIEKPSLCTLPRLCSPKKMGKRQIYSYSLGGGRNVADPDHDYLFVDASGQDFMLSFFITIFSLLVSALQKNANFGKQRSGGVL